MTLGKRLWNAAHRQYRRQGYHVFRSVFSRHEIDALADVSRHMVPSFEAAILRQSGKKEVHAFFPGTQLIRNPPCNAHLPLEAELQPLTSALQAIITSSTLAERLDEIDGAKHYDIHQTLLFFAAQTTDLHLDSWTVDTAPRGFSHTVWIPLQDMNFLSGLPCVVPWPQGELVTEEDLGLTNTEAPFHERYDKYHRAFNDKLIKRSPEVVTSFVQRGDFIVWSSLTPHCTLPSRPELVERLSVQLLIRPSHHRWGNFVVQPDQYPFNRVIRATDRFSYFVAEEIMEIYGTMGNPSTQ